MGGVVLVMSLWDDHFANMLWLDSIYPTDSTDPTNYRGSCSIDSGLPADVEVNDAKSHVIFSNIRSGKIGTTTGASPSPTPTPPASCTATGADPWATGSHVDCCAGSTETLVHDSTWHYICQSGKNVIVFFFSFFVFGFCCTNVFLTGILLSTSQILNFSTDSFEDMWQQMTSLLMVWTK